MTVKVLVIGVGGVGSIAAYTLQKNGCEVSTVARSQYEVLAKDGFKVESVDYGETHFKPDHVYKSAEEAVADRGVFDYVLFATKNVPDVSPLEKIIENVYNKDTAIVLLQNGIGIEKTVFKAFPDATCISGVTMISSTLYGTTVKQVATDSVTWGPFINTAIDKDAQIAKAKKWAEIYSNGINESKYDENVNFIRWRKLIYNAAVNTTCAITDVDCGRLELFGGMDKIARPAMHEIRAIAKADGVDLPESVIEFMIRSDDGEYYPPSMLIDVRKNQYTEYKTIVANALDIAREKGVATPVLDILCDLLEVIQYRTMESKGRFTLPEQRPYPQDNFKIEFKD